MQRSTKYSSFDCFHLIALPPDVKYVRIKYPYQGHLQSLHWQCNLLNLLASSTVDRIEKAAQTAAKRAKLAVFMLQVESGTSPCPIIRLSSFLKLVGKILFQEHPDNCSSKIHKVPSGASGTLYTVQHLGILQAGWNGLQVDGSQLYSFLLVSFYTAIFMYVHI